MKVYMKSKLQEIIRRKVKQILLEATTTPWGTADQVVKVVPGVVWYSTPSHGGMRVANKYLSDIAKHLALKSAGGYWFEEDIQWTIPVYENYDTWGKEFFAKVGGKVVSKDELESDIKHWYPDYFNDDVKKKASSIQSGMAGIKNLKAGDKVFLKGYSGSPFTIQGLLKKDVYVVRDKKGVGPYKMTKSRIMSAFEKLEPAKD